MPYAASCSKTTDTRRALEEASRDVAAQLAGRRPDLSFLFASRHHAAEFETIAAAAQELTGNQHILGCTGESIAAGSHEFEETAVLSLWSAALPGASLETFHV